MIPMTPGERWPPIEPTLQIREELKKKNDIDFDKCHDLLVFLTGIWVRDAKFPISIDTELYIASHFASFINDYHSQYFDPELRGIGERAVALVRKLENR